MSDVSAQASSGSQEPNIDWSKTLQKQSINDAKRLLAEKLGRDPTPAEVAKYLKSHQQQQDRTASNNDGVTDPPTDTTIGTPINPNTVKQAQEDLRKILDREPTAEEVEEQLQDILGTPGQNEASTKTSSNNEDSTPQVIRVDQQEVSKAQNALRQKLGRDATAQEVEEYLTRQRNHAQRVPPRPRRPAKKTKKVGKDIVKEAQTVLRYKLGREATPEEVEKYLTDTGITGSQGQNKPVKVDPQVVSDAQKALKEKLGRDPTPAEMEEYLQENQRAQPSKKVTKVDQSVVNNGVKALKEKLGRDPTPGEMEEYLEEQANKDQNRTKIQKVDPGIVNEVMKDLRELLGRDPTPQEVEDFLSSMGEDALNDGDTQSDLMVEYRNNLRAILGRDPNLQELEDYAKDMNSDYPLNEASPFFGNPLLGFGDPVDPSTLPPQPYTAEDAIKSLTAEGNLQPTDADINDWLFEHNEPYFGIPSFDNVEIPGVTSQYVSPVDNGLFSSTNIMFLLIVMLLGGLFYKQRNKRTGQADDDFSKLDQKPMYEKFLNPFNRRNPDGDDDFDKVL